MKKITKTTMKRATRTFLQAFIGALISTGSAVTWFDVDIKEAVIGIFITSIFAGLSALGMNLERDDQYE